MPSAFAISVIYAVLSVVVAGAWVAGYLDKYQKMAQNALLGGMGENRMSYGLKSKHSKPADRTLRSASKTTDATQAPSRVRKSETRTLRIYRAA